MPKLRVAREVTVAAPTEKVFAVVRDFRQWGPWSPWLIAEPGCEVTFGDDGKSYRWDGEIVGSGEMAVTSEDPPRSVGYRLAFLRPWKSESSVRFELAPQGGATRATWTMDGSLPVFMFWMKRMMEAFVGMDYQRGLAMLKDYVESGSVPSALEFPGVQPFPGCAYLGTATTCPTPEIGPRMLADIAKVRDALNAAGLAPPGPPFAVYHKWDVIGGTCSYTFAFPVASPPATIPPGLLAGRIPDLQTYQVRHTGAYRHVGNAWSAGIMHGRAKRFHQSRHHHPFEVYQTDPDQVPEEQAVTTVHFPVK